MQGHVTLSGQAIIESLLYLRFIINLKLYLKIRKTES